MIKQSVIINYKFKIKTSVVVDVIHTVGPKGEKPDLLKAAYENCLKLCVENNLKTVVSLAISLVESKYCNIFIYYVSIIFFRLFLAFQLEFTVC